MTAVAIRRAGQLGNVSRQLTYNAIVYIANSDAFEPEYDCNSLLCLSSADYNLAA
jgi:hypothetical protein